MSASPDRASLEILHERFKTELHDRVLAFWLRHSLDREHGGYLNCLDRDGKPWDTSKHVWLQGRQVWMLSRVYNTVDKRPEILDAATLGATFLRRHARRPDNRVYFALTRDGKPLQLQRKIFSECFYVMAMAEYARATGDAQVREEARSLFEAVLEFAKDSRLVGRPVFEGETPTNSLAVPMILLDLVHVVHDPGETTYDHVTKWCVERIMPHIRPELKLVLEHVGADGNLLDSPAGRIVNPGHAIECGWFLLAHAKKTGDAQLVARAIEMIEWSWDYGWDDEFGGLMYFLDREGYSPSQLEWNMKLWWPHCEALVAWLMVWNETGKAEHWNRFMQATEYTFAHFPDPEFGEWFGYLDRRGEPTHRFKGGPYKGCFHVPRALFLCERILAARLGK